MSITDELREFASHCAGGMGGDSLRHIADRIDAEHEAMLGDARKYVYEGYVKLPVDADGVPIRVGDVLDPPADCDDYAPLQVVRLMYDGYEQEWFFDGEAGGFCGMVGEHMDVAGWTHHHAPTVEDVMVEFATDWESAQDGEDKTAVLKEYAAKLRLAGDGE